MNPDEPSTASHSLVAALDRFESEFAAAENVPVWSLDTGTTAATLQRLIRLESRLAGLKLAVLAHGETVDVAGPSGASSTATWLAHATRHTRADAHGQLKLAVALSQDKHTCVRDALAAGGLRVEQARVIVGAVDDLPTAGDEALDPDTICKAEAWLVEQAGFHDAKALRILGARLLEVAAPDKADAYEAKKLADQERRAAEATRLTLSEDGQGSVFVRGKIPVLHSAMLTKMLHAYAAPKHQTAVNGAGASAERKPSPQRLGQAFCELIENLSAHDHPQTGGTGATLVVTLDLDILQNGLKAARLDTGQKLSPGQTRRLACQAGLVPAVLGGQSQPLDLGRSQRFHTRAQRTAIALRDGGCTAEGCDWPPGMCHVHHDPPFSAGGPTDVDHARMLCPHHHTRAHDPTYTTTKLPNGKVAFHRRT